MIVVNGLFSLLVVLLNDGVYTFWIFYGLYLEKRRKSKGSYKADKKDKSNINDGSTPTVMTKTKTVHGVVGPAEYITETSPTHDEPSNVYSNQTSVNSNVAVSQKVNSQGFNQQTTNNQAAQQNREWSANQPSQINLQQIPQQQEHSKPKYNQSNSTPNFQHAHFPSPSPTQYNNNFNAI